MELSRVWHIFESWFVGHGWKLLIIAIVASLVRRFGMLVIQQIIHRSIDNSGRIESKRDKKLRANTIIGLINSVFKVMTFIIIGLLVLSELNVLRVVMPLLAGAGVVSLLFGFGIQTFVKDFISGIFIVAENQYRVGDVVLLTTSVGGEVEGMVTQVSLRTTVLRDNDGAIHFVPNGNVARAANLTLDYAKVSIKIQVPIESNLTKLEEEVNTIGASMKQDHDLTKKLIEPPHLHGVTQVSPEGATIEIRAKTTPAAQWQISNELHRQLAGLMASYAHKKK